GVIGHGVISPANTFWYNDGITKPAYDTVLADQILDAKFGAWSPLAQPCTKDNPSMCRSLGTRGTALFEILTPQADYDPIRAASGQMIAAAMQSVGINVVSTPLAFGEIVARLDARNFDQYILGWRIGGTDPDYLFSFWDSSNAAGGQNYPGFNNATFDTTIRASRAELNRTLRHDLIFTAQDILADARPYEVLYYRTNIEGYRQDRFVNWTVSSGTIWNYYSLLGIRPPSEKRLTITPTLKSAVLSGLTAPLTVTVFDQARAKVAGASVRVELSAAGTGNLSDGTNPPASNVTVVTDASGQAVVSYIAPIRGVGNASLNVLIDMTANKQPEFPDEAFRTTQITVFAEGEQFLAVTTNLPNGDVTTPGGTLLLEVSVADQLGFPVSDADVTIESGSTQVTATPASGTSGTLPTVSLKALSTITASLNADLTVTANKTAFADGVTDFQISVVVSGSTSCPQGQVWDPTTNSCRQTTSTPGLEAVAIIALVGAIGAAAVVVRRREK
ncbi:MAG TPA: hypothetical protein VJ397_09435, partial [Thermoplasmata archaeon]|nr:hypothetical protein [Thermoplasmata archaeon]